MLSSANQGSVEIEKQRLVKFPDDDDQQHKQFRDQETDKSTPMDRESEAKRILEEINKINQALGYIKKHPIQNKFPHVLDSSQFLFPKPAYHPLNAQTHQIAGSNGATILVPSIRAANLYGRRHIQNNDSNIMINYKESMPQKTVRSKFISNNHEFALNENNRKHQNISNAHLRYRSNQFNAATSPQPAKDKQTLLTHFMVPVRLYKLDKEEFIKKYSPEEYRKKGYKVVGEIDHLFSHYTKSNKNGKRNPNATKNSPKYHLFFFPHELTLNEIAEIKREQIKHNDSLQQNSRREEKVRTIQRQAAGIEKTNLNKTMQSTRKRVTVKPITNGTKAPLSNNANIHLQPAPPSIKNNLSEKQNSVTKISNNNSSKVNTLLNSPSAVITDNSDKSAANGTTTTNSIKSAFQNIFKFPFRQEAKPVISEQTNFEPIPIKIPEKTFFNSQSLMPSKPTVLFQHQHHNPTAIDTDFALDYKWADEDGNESSSVGDEEYAGGSSEQSEKQLFGNLHSQHHQTQKEAMRHGGIIIQRLKVRKGGIAIAGPGGVATAGSGGTAIVGPGGYALTHPRSLTIAGPGAKIIAIPPNIDLMDALTRTNLYQQTFPREGKIVATGPTVYYSPATRGTEDIL